MKKVMLWGAPFLLMSATCKKVVDRSTVFIKDCTGSYLRYEGKDYHICNTEMTATLSNGDTALAIFNKIKECNGTAKNGIICMMYHANEGWIQVESAKYK